MGSEVREVVVTLPFMDDKPMNLGMLGLPLFGSGSIVMGIPVTLRKTPTHITWNFYA